MSTPRTSKSQRQAPVSPRWHEARWTIPALFLFFVLCFHAAPLFSPSASIQWDAVDVHYSAQRYFSDNLLAGHLPHWTPYVFSGAPFLADPQTGAWYPLNWPFFLAGVTPRAIAWELALHALLAGLGAFLLTRDLLGARAPAVFAGLVYAFSGFFVGHSSHAGMFQAAALLPWLLWLMRRAVCGNWRIYAPLAVLTGGAMMLAGHFQSALYAFFALALFVGVEMILNEPGWRKRAPLVLVAVVAGATLVSAIQVLPGLELTTHSIRAQADYSRQADATVTPGSLATLFAPNFYGAVTGAYKGPGDITQYFFYQGLLAPLLALAGCFARGRVRWVAIGLAGPALWYGLGPGAGLYALMAQLPAFRSVRAPVHIWFVVALGLALAAAAGAALLAERWRKPWLIPALIAFAFVDLSYWNASGNALAYGHASFDELYGNAADNFERASASARATTPHRLWFERDLPGFGPMNGALNSHTEVTFGYNPLELARYSAYRTAAAGNPALLEGLAVTHRIDPSKGGIVPMEHTLPRVSVPPAVQTLGSADAARAALAALKPAENALLETAPAGLRQDAQAKAELTGYEGDRYRIRYSAASPTAVRVAVPYFPGWTARLNGAELPVLPMDYALTAVVAPAGTGEIELAYHSNWFAKGAALSALGLALAMAVLAWGLATRRNSATA